MRSLGVSEVSLANMSIAKRGTSDPLLFPRCSSIARCSMWSFTASTTCRSSVGSELSNVAKVSSRSPFVDDKRDAYKSGMRALYCYTVNQFWTLHVSDVLLPHCLSFEDRLPCHAVHCCLGMASDQQMSSLATTHSPHC